MGRKFQGIHGVVWQSLILYSVTRVCVYPWPAPPSLSPPSLAGAFPSAPAGSSEVVVLGEVGDEGDGHAHVDAGSDGDGQHGQEQGPPGAGASLVEVSLGHGFVGLQNWRRKRKSK